MFDFSYPRVICFYRVIRKWNAMELPLQDPEGTQLRRLISKLRFRDLQLLVVLQTTGSLRAAAAALNLTQPALSKTLREIERAFGCELFERGARGLTPNSHGSLAIRGAAMLMQELAHIGAEAVAKPAVTIVRVGAPPFVAQGVLPWVFRRLLEDDSDVRIQLQEERVPLLVNSLLAGRLDALISSYPTDLPEAAGGGLRYEKLFDAAFVVIAPIDHPAARARRIDWQRLSTARWVMPASSSMVRRVMDDAFRREGVTAPVPVVESTSPFTNLRLVAEGIGLSAVPESALQDALIAARVKRVNVQPPIASWPVALISREEPANPRVELIRRVLSNGRR